MLASLWIISIWIFMAIYPQLAEVFQFGPKWIDQQTDFAAARAIALT